MQKNLVIGISVVAACVVVCASYSSVVSVQLVKASNDRVINDTFDQKELLFQTIVDMLHNKDVQRVILGSELTRKQFIDPDMNFFIFNHPVLTEKFLKRAYTLESVLLRTLSPLRINTTLEKYHANDQTVQKKFATVVEKDTALKAEVAQLSSLSCNCENGNTIFWKFPVICVIIVLLVQFFTYLSNLSPDLSLLCFVPIFLLTSLYEFLQCSVSPY
jgi:hypothetical protein